MYYNQNQNNFFFGYGSILESVDLYTPTKYFVLSLRASQLDNLPENSPINIVQTPIPITTSVPKRAKSQRKKALAAALATAQEYSEISMEQKKLQVYICTVSSGHVGWIAIEQFKCYDLLFLCVVSSTLVATPYYYSVLQLFDWFISVTLFCFFFSLPNRRHSLKRLGRRVKPLWSWTWETCWRLWRNISKL